MNKCYLFQNCDKDKILNEKMHQFVRGRVAKLLNVSIEKIQIKKGDFGKPYISEYENVLQFNISHTENVGIVLFYTTPIGIDIECITKKTDYKIAQRFFCKNEKKYVLSESNENEKRRRFYEVWTKKEAYIKYLGLGFQKSLLSFDVFSNEINNIMKTIIVDNYIISMCGIVINHDIKIININMDSEI